MGYFVLFLFCFVCGYFLGPIGIEESDFWILAVTVLVIGVAILCGYALGEIGVPVPLVIGMVLAAIIIILL